MPAPQQQQQVSSNNLNNSNNASVSLAALTSNVNGNTIDTSKLTEDERNQLRQQLLVEINEAVKRYGFLSTMWSFIYYVVAGLAIAGNAIVLIISSSLISMAFPETPSWVPILNTVASLVAGGAVAVNAQLQSRMNAVYFHEAKEKYLDLKTIMWIDLMKAVNDLAALDQIYDASGVGGLISLEGVVSTVSGKKKNTYVNKKFRSETGMPSPEEIELAIQLFQVEDNKIEKKRYAYPTPRHLEKKQQEARKK